MSLPWSSLKYAKHDLVRVRDMPSDKFDPLFNMSKTERSRGFSSNSFLTLIGRLGSRLSLHSSHSNGSIGGTI